MQSASSLDPAWIAYLKSNTEMFGNFLEWIVLAEEDIMRDMRKYVAKDDFTKVKICEGELQALDKLRNLSTIAEKEEASFADYKRQLSKH